MIRRDVKGRCKKEEERGEQYRDRQEGKVRERESEMN